MEEEGTEVVEGVWECWSVGVLECSTRDSVHWRKFEGVGGLRLRLLAGQEQKIEGALGPGGSSVGG